jgi:hypothetical protein
MWGRTSEQIPTSFDIFRESADIINPTEFYVDRFRGFELTTGQSPAALAFRLLFLNSLLLLLLPLVLMLYYLSSHVMKQQVTQSSQESVWRDVCVTAQSVRCLEFRNRAVYSNTTNVQCMI